MMNLPRKRYEAKPIIIPDKTDMIGKLSEIQKRLMDISPSNFEQLVCETLNLKYGVKTVKTRDVADGGVDFVSLNDRGHIKYRGQIKRTSKNISNSEILQLRGLDIYNELDDKFKNTLKIKNNKNR
jgi:HJR/Mrr/RecB family endonuclease